MTTIEYSDALADFLAKQLGVPESETFRDTVGLAVEHLNDESDINEAMKILPGSVRHACEAVLSGSLIRIRKSGSTPWPRPMEVTP
jgi:hypothetical protein